MSDEAVGALLAFIHQLETASQREFLRLLEEDLQVELDSDSARLKRIALALHQTTRTLGKAPSVREYRRLRRENPERGWPDPRSVTRWLGVRSWNDALVRVGLEAVLDGDTIEGAIGPAYSIEEVIQAVRDCADELGRPPTITEYLAWQQRPDVRDRPGRRPASTWVFNRIFGGFPQARVAAGLVEGEPTAAHPSELLLRTANYRLSTEQILTDIRDVARRTRGHLTGTVYDRERRLIYVETRAVGRPRALAGVGTIYRHFGSWTAAVLAAEIDGACTMSAEVARQRRRLSDEQILRAIDEANRATADRLTTYRYIAWREQQIASNPARQGEFPSHTTIHRRIGSWAEALEAAGIDVPQMARRSHRSALSTEQLLRALHEADATTSRRLTISRYTAWRAEQLMGDPKLGVSLPVHTTIRQRFGGWLTALERMHEWRQNR